jgi:hypothetical protein
VKLDNLANNNMQTIVVVFISVIVVIIPLIWFYKKVWKTASIEVDMLEDGFTSDAKILEINSTGAIFGHSPSMSILMEVRHPDGSVYIARIQEIVLPITLLSKLLPGTIVCVKIAKKDKNVVTLDDQIFRVGKL